jgi:hypothetical protein
MNPGLSSLTAPPGPRGVPHGVAGTDSPQPPAPHQRERQKARSAQVQQPGSKAGRNQAGQFIHPEGIPPEEEEKQAGQTQEQGGGEEVRFKGRPFKIKSAPTDQRQQERNQRQPAPGAAEKEAFQVFLQAGLSPGIPGPVVSAAAGAALRRGIGQGGATGDTAGGRVAWVKQGYSIQCCLLEAIEMVVSLRVL